MADGVAFLKKKAKRKKGKRKKKTAKQHRDALAKNRKLSQDLSKCTHLQRLETKIKNLGIRNFHFFKRKETTRIEASSMVGGRLTRLCNATMLG